MRIALGAALCVGGLFWFLPVVGLWMLPLGLMMLSIDLAPARRLRRRIGSWWARRRKAAKKS